VDPLVGRTAFRLGMMVTVPALAMLLVLPRESAEFAISVVTVMIGGVFLGLVTLIVRRAQR
jgi:hypothetical protein